MGLDMYLYKRSYVKNWNYMRSEERHQITVSRDGKPLADIKPERISHIIEQVAYWRKANQIHKWFVDNVQGGVDECQESHVSKEQLAELVGLCKQVLNTVETVPGAVHTGTMYYPDGKVVEQTKEGVVVAQVGLAEELLPTASGFFFGGTDYDEYYLEDLKHTIEQIEPLLSEDGDDDFYYRSSW